MVSYATIPCPWFCISSAKLIFLCRPPTVVSLPDGFWLSRSVRCCCLGGEHTSAFEGLLKVTHHVERSFGIVITSSLKELAESFDGLGKFTELTRVRGEDLRHEEGLRKELLDLTGSSNGQLIFFGKIIHTENSNNILERLVVLEELLDTTSSLVMDISEDEGIQHSGGRVEGIDSGVDTEFGKGTRQDSLGIQMGEGGSRGGIGQIISGYEDGLDGGNGSVSGSGNSFLEGTQISSEGRLVTDSGRDTSEKGRHFRASLGESEDVIDEQKHILVLFVSEVLSNGESGKSDTGSGTWGLVHLSVHESGLGAISFDINDTGFNHLIVEIVTLTSSFSYSSEDGVTTMSLGDIVNKLHDKYGLTDTGTTEKSNLTSSGVGGKEIDNLDTYIQSRQANRI